MKSMFDTPSLANGSILQNRYEVVKELGRGGFGRTYLARDRHQRGEYCVLKEFAPQVSDNQQLNKAKELFDREAKVLYRLQHPQIPRFREMLTTSLADRELMFLVQDYVEGETYADLLERYRQRGQRFGEQEVFNLLIAILPVLAYIHSQGAIHRDISPDNLIRRTSDKLPVLIDFGGVKQAAVTAVSLFGAKKSLTRIGKPNYAPEEQLREGRADASSDLYALGVTALVLLTGKEPDELYDSHNATWKWRSQVNITPSFATILEKAIAHLPAQRYQSAAELLQVLQQHRPSISGMRTVVVSPSQPPTTPTPFPNTPPISLPAKPNKRAIFVGLGAIALGLTIWGLRGNNPFNFGRPSEAEIPKIELDKRSDLNQRRKAVKMSQQDFNQRVNAEFYARHPELKQRQLTNKAEDAKLRREWYDIGDRLLNKLEKQQKKSAKP